MHEALVKKLSELFRDYASHVEFTGLARGGLVKGNYSTSVILHPRECIMRPDILPRYTVEELAQACEKARQGGISIKVNVSGSNGSAKG